ncbi:MAG TPA: helix-turn-helix domain-containing protein [Pirellulales bacterium]|jgi:excisionase family DNA binding protein|nr:helix-turn-helix domain-containing protein [Pirellulales bacterium]
MANKDDRLNLTDKEILQSFADPAWSAKFPPVMSVEQAAELLQVPVATIYDWRSRGLLDGCCCKVGKHLRFLRDRLLKQIFN